MEVVILFAAGKILNDAAANRVITGIRLEVPRPENINQININNTRATIIANSSKWRGYDLITASFFLAFNAATLILFIFLPASNLSAVLFGTSFGLLWLATVPATNGIVAQIFGTKNLSLLFGIVFLNHQFGSFLGAYLGGYFYDNFGSFDYAWYLAIILSFIAAAIHLPIDEKPIQKATVTP